MTLLLYEHNENAFQLAVDMLDITQKTAVIHPTGTGKSFIGFKLCESVFPEKVCWLSPSDYIFRTQVENLRQVDRDFDISNITFFTYAKLMVMSEKEITAVKPKYIILDEFHRCGAEMWGAGVQKLLGAYPKAKVLGLSATAIRYLDNQRNMADELFAGSVASEMTLGEAIVRGILTSPKYVLSVYSYKSSLTEYQNKIKRTKNLAVRDKAQRIFESLRRTLENAVGIGKIFAKHINPNGKYIAFCAGVDHMEAMKKKIPEWFYPIDKETKVYTAYCENPDTDKEFLAFKQDQSAHLKLLFCIDMLNEGVHIDDVDGVILFRPTVSPIIYKQQIGRALSASKKTKPVIFDIVNNLENLYGIDSIQDEMDVAISYYRDRGWDDLIVNTTFELYDEVKESRNIFDKLNDTLTASWDMMYKYATDFYKENGHLEVPKRYKTEEGYSLGSWITVQRQVRSGEHYGILGQDRIEKLDAIGMRWNSLADENWNKYFQAASNYFDKNGNLNTTVTYKTADGLKLGEWICRIRTYRKSKIKIKYLTPERISYLDTIGMIWDQIDYLWEKNFDSAKRYFEEHGNLDVPFKYVDADGIKLGAWIHKLKSIRRGKAVGAELSAEQIRRLDSIGMTWSKRNDSSWEKGYLQACKYYKTHGNLDVKPSFIDETGFKLGDWIANQRENKNISSYRKEQLNKIGMVWTKTDNWEIRFALCREYYQTNGNLNIPPRYKVNGIWLAKWLNEQKNVYRGKRSGKTLSAEQIQKLESIGIEWGNKTDINNENAWKKQFQIAKEYSEKYGTLKITSEESTAEEKKIFTWLVIQRRYYKSGKLSQEKIILLESIGMVWDDDTWENAYQHAKKYFEENKNLNVPMKYICRDGFRLGIWISNQRRKYKKNSQDKLFPERISMLEKIGMIWEPSDMHWEQRYIVAKTYYTEFGTIKVPKGYKPIGMDFDLFTWIDEQKRKIKKGNVSEERINKLKAIGIY